MADLASILTKLEPLLGSAEGDPSPLDGGITNRNYRALLGGQAYVIRVPGKRTQLLGISRDAERIASEGAAALGIAPPVAAVIDGCLVTAYLACSPVTAAELAADPAPIAHALRAFHDSGLALPVRFWVPELLDAYAATVQDRGLRLPDAYARSVRIVARIAAVLPLIDPVCCHDDLLPANVIRVGAGSDAGAATGVAGDLLLVDWEYAGMGHRFFDLGNLAVNNDFDDAAELRLLGAYFGQTPPPSRHAALKLMRLMSDAREAAWGVVQSAISELDFDFNAYADRHFGRLDAAAADPDFEEWLRAAAA